MISVLVSSRRRWCEGWHGRNEEKKEAQLKVHTRFSTYYIVLYLLVYLF